MVFKLLKFVIVINLGHLFKCMVVTCFLPAKVIKSKEHLTVGNTIRKSKVCCNFCLLIENEFSHFDYNYFKDYWCSYTSAADNIGGNH